MDGGPSQLDTFDPKPDAPRGYRSDFGTVRTRVPGLYVSALLPRLARLMHRCTLVRTVAHQEGSHERACHLLLTGQLPEAHEVRPGLGAVVARGLGPAAGAPPYVTISSAGFAFGFGEAGPLGPSFDPVRVRGRSLRTRGTDTAQGVWELEREPSAVRDRYGRHAFGEGCLLARRLVERGTRFVTVSHGGWDTHSDNAQALEGWLAPPLDRGMSALIEDLAQRGLLEETLVVWMGEFGRSPALNPLAGRDHWPRAGCALFAGAGVPGGQVIGRTDRHGAEPLERPVAPADIAATILGKLGIDPSAAGCPSPASGADTGHLIRELG